MLLPSPEQIDKLWQDVRARLRANGQDPDEVIQQAGSILSAWRRAPSEASEYPGDEPAVDTFEAYDAQSS